MKKTIILKEDHNDEWARVELYRWQHGHLPGDGNKPEQPLSEAAGLRGMATAIERGKISEFPSPMNVVSVLRYAARLVDAFELSKASVKSLRGRARKLTDGYTERNGIIKRLSKRI